MKKKLRYNKSERLRELLFRKAKMLSDKAVQEDGQFSEEQLGQLDRIAKLIEISEAAKPRLLKKRWPVVAAFLLTLIIVSILLFATVSEIEIELDLSVSEVRFELPIRQVLTEVFVLSSLGIFGLEKIEMPYFYDRSLKTGNDSKSDGSAINLSAITEGKRKGEISFATLILQAGTYVWLRRNEVRNQYRLSLSNSDIDLRADVSGPIQIGLYGSPVKQSDFAVPRSITMQQSFDDVVIDLTFYDNTKRNLSPNIFAKNLSLFRIEEFSNEKQTFVRHVSTIHSGTIYLESLNSKKYLLKPFEDLHFEQSNGEFRSIQLANDLINLKFHGFVRGMSSGSGENQRSLMPSYLEWLRARHGLSLFWGTILYIVVLTVSFLRWWREP